MAGSEAKQTKMAAKEHRERRRVYCNQIPGEATTGKKTRAPKKAPFIDVDIDINDSALDDLVSLLGASLEKDYLEMKKRQVLELSKGDQDDNQK